MKQYIGTKLVEAEPQQKDGREGYRVRYAGGYESWSPKEAFEMAYLALTVNEELRTEKPSISAKMVKEFIKEKEVITMGDKTTVVRAVLRNGFEIVEASSCVSPENYDEDLGAKICMERIEGKVWMLLGFLLQTAVGGI